MPQETTLEDRDVINRLVQDGLIEVVSIDADGSANYRLASGFTMGGERGASGVNPRPPRISPS